MATTSSTSSYSIGVNSASSGISFSGLGSGIDTNAIVTQLMSLERRPITTLTTQKSKIDVKNTVEAGIQGLFNTLKTKAQALMATDAFNTSTVSVKDSTILSASSTASAAAGTYQVTVSQLARAHTLESSATPTLTSDTMTLTAGSTSVNVAVNAGESLSALAERINNTTDTPASASVINNHLVLISKTEGSGGALVVTSSGSTATDLGFVERQSAQDAIATVNGVSITSSGNTIDSAITGVTLNLAKEGSTTFTVARNADAVTGSVQAFVDAYNTTIGNMKTALKYDASSKQSGALQGDSSYQMLVSQLRDASGSKVTSLTGDYTSLASIGITADRAGTLSLNATTFKAALAKNPSAVADLFTKDSGAAIKTSADGIATHMANLAGTIATDVIGKRLSSYTTQTNRINQKITDLEAVMVTRESRLRAKFSAMDTQVANFSAIGAQLTSKLG